MGKGRPHMPDRTWGLHVEVFGVQLLHIETTRAALDDQSADMPQPSQVGFHLPDDGEVTTGRRGSRSSTSRSSRQVLR